jgi:sortase A
MRLARVLGATGRTLITAGTLILLFVAYQLWGTGIREAQAQNRLEADFEQALEQVDAAALPADHLDEPGGDDPADPAAQDDPAQDGGERDGRGRDRPEVFRRDSVPLPEPGQPVGRIRIPAIEVDKIVVQGVSLLELKSGPGHFPETPLPGQRGNAAIAGHRTTYGAPFHRLDELQPGDEIFVETVQGEFRYEVLDPPHLIVVPTDVWVLDKDEDHPNMLTLAACHPKYSARERIVVRAELAGDQEALPATPTPRQEAAGTPGPSTLDDIDGEEVAIWPAVLLGLLCGAIWLVAWAVGRWWRPLPSYALGLPVFLVGLFFFFEEFSRLLPSSF